MYHAINGGYKVIKSGSDLVNPFFSFPTSASKTSGSNGKYFLLPFRGL